jgi:proteasome lid subunit RPN8/RPN11
MSRNPPSPLEIPSTILSEMVEHCRRDAPLEACGILGGVPSRALSIHPLRNTVASETLYDADPRDILEAYQSLRSRSHQFLAIYHSHPRWQAVPSRTDLERNYYGDLPRIIVSLLKEPPDVRVWRLGAETYDELPWVEVAGDVPRPYDVEPSPRNH